MRLENCTACQSAVGVLPVRHYDPPLLLRSLVSPNPYSETSERSPPFIRVVILELRAKCQLVRVEVKPAIQDSHRIRMLNHSIPYQRLHNVVRCRYEATASGRVVIDCHVLLGPECVYIVNGVLFTGGNVYAAAVV